MGRAKKGYRPNRARGSASNPRLTRDVSQLIVRSRIALARRRLLWALATLLAVLASARLLSATAGSISLSLFGRKWLTGGAFRGARRRRRGSRLRRPLTGRGIILLQAVGDGYWLQKAAVAAVVLGAAVRADGAAAEAVGVLLVHTDRAGTLVLGDAVLTDGAAAARLALLLPLAVLADAAAAACLALGLPPAVLTEAAATARLALVLDTAVLAD